MSKNKQIKQVNIKVSENLYNFLQNEMNRLQNSMAGVVKMYLRYGLDAHQTGRFDKIENGQITKL